MTTLLEVEDSRFIGGERTSKIPIVGKAAIYTRVSSDRQRKRAHPWMSSGTPVSATVPPMGC